MAGRSSSGDGLSNAVSRILDMYRTMHVIRAFELAAAEAWHAGHVRGSVHQYIGQEAIAVGVCANLLASDYVSSNHRNHGHNIAKGTDPRRMIFELLGRAEGTCGGKAGSLHIADFSVRMLGANGVVGDGVSIAVGAAQSSKLLGQNRIAVPFFGDGAINRGPLMEALNWAKIYKLPVLFVCEDNAYAASTLTKEVTAGDFPARAAAFAISGEHVDGNDLLAVDAAAERLVARIRRGEGPAYLYATTYRHKGHFAHDKALYRDAIAHEASLKADPVPRCAEWLLAQGVASMELDDIAARAKSDIARAVDEALTAPWPDQLEAFTGVQTLGAPQ
jgi:acetoin:2,6-dichlorophenolindophenol oxidoreductase subunit alpha